MPYPKDGESKNEYINRCIPYMMENEGKKKDQAVAMCHAFWKEYGPGTKESIEERIDNLLVEFSELVGFTRKEIRLMESHFRSERWEKLELETPDTYYASNGNIYGDDDWEEVVARIYKERYRKTGETVYRAIKTIIDSGEEYGEEYPAGDLMSKPFGGAESIAELKKLLRKITE